MDFNEPEESLSSDDEKISAGMECLDLSSRSESLIPIVSGEDSGKKEGVVSYKFFGVDCDRVLLILFKPCTLHFYGSVSVKSVAGSVDVCGYHIDPSKSQVQVYSIEGYDPVYFTTLDQNVRNDKMEVSDLLEFGLNHIEATEVGKSVKLGGCVLLLSHPKMRVFARPATSMRAEGRIGISVETPSSTNNKLVIPLELTFDLTGITVVCGSKGVGKTVLLKYLANRCLNKSERILFIDLNLSQPEFTLPECVSAILVDEPFLGPSWSHFRKPLFSYHAGSTDVTLCASNYLNAVKKLIFKLKSSNYSSLPWFVNTVGYSHTKLALYIETFILASLSPDLVVQVVGKNSENFPSDLTPSYVTLKSKTKELVSDYCFLKVNKSNLLVKNSFAPLFKNRELTCLTIEWYFNDSLKFSKPLTCSTQALRVFNMVTKQLILQEDYSALTSKIILLSSSFYLRKPREVLDFGFVLRYVESDKVFIIKTPLKNCRNIRSILVGVYQNLPEFDKALNSGISRPAL